jgi:hypothetical protein
MDIMAGSVKGVGWSYGEANRVSDLREACYGRPLLLGVVLATGGTPDPGLSYHRRMA